MTISPRLSEWLLVHNSWSVPNLELGIQTDGLVWSGIVLANQVSSQIRASDSRLN